MDVINEQEELDTSSSLESSVHHFATSVDTRSPLWADSKEDVPIRLSFYFPNQLDKESVQKESDSINTAQATDIVGRVMETYNHLSSWKKIQLYELIFSIIIVFICFVRNDLVSICILLILCNHGFSTAMMIPHYCYSWILFITSFFMICRYFVQLPIIKQCVDNEGYYYFTVSKMCSATTTPLIDAYQPLHIIGLLRRDDYNRKIASSILSDIMIVLCVVVMRSILKRSGLWKKSLGYYVLSEVLLTLFLRNRLSWKNRMWTWKTVWPTVSEFDPILLIRNLIVQSWRKRCWMSEK